MKPIFIPILFFIVFYSSQCCGQIRLNPVDSTVKEDWSRKYPISIMVSIGGFGSIALNSGYNNYFKYAKNQGADPERLLNVMSFDWGLRVYNTFFTLSSQLGLVGLNDDFDRSTDRIYWQQNQNLFSFSVGQMFWKNQSVMILGGLGIGYAEFESQYYYSGNSVFDFETNNRFQIEGSPTLRHQTGFWDIGADIIFGLRKEKKGLAFQKLEVGYRQGLAKDQWKPVGYEVSNPLTDRMGQFYLNTIIGLSFNYIKKELR